MKKIRVNALALFLSVILAFSYEASAYADNVNTNILTKEDTRILDSIFDPIYYAENNPDVVKQLGTEKAALFKHFCTYGLHELRQPSPVFNVSAYAAGYNDLSAAFGTDVLSYYKHYYEYGKKEERIFTTPESLSILGINGSMLLAQQKTVPDANGRPQFNVFYEEESKDFIIPYDDNYDDDEPEPEPSPIIYTVHFDVSYNDCNIPDQQVRDGEKATRPTPDPSRDDISFNNWYTDETRENPFNFNDPITHDTTIYAKWGEDACLAAGTLITLANGERTPVENLKLGDEVRVFDHETGKISTANLYSCIVYSENETTGFTLHFSNNIDITVVGGHCFFEKSENKYITLTYYNATKYIGHSFYNADEDCWETLESVEYIAEPLDSFFIASENNINIIANGMLSGEDAEFEVFLNVFDYGDELIIDKEKKEADITKYGLWDFEESKYIAKWVYDALNLEYLAVAFGKGMITPREIEEIEEMCLLYPELLE